MLRFFAWLDGLDFTRPSCRGSSWGSSRRPAYLALQVLKCRYPDNVIGYNDAKFAV
jgi:hypothetical protein